MLDGQGRTIDYLRISLTDRCNLRCLYCIPGEAPCWLPQERLLTGGELLRIVKLLVQMGIRDIRLTGGEPLCREDIATLAGHITSLEGVRRVCLTTNGVLLAQKLPKLLEAGISGVNLSLNALERDCYREIAGRDLWEKAWEGFQAAVSCGDRLTVKVNVVPMRGRNEDQLIPLAGLAARRPVHVRFIEMMPVGRGAFVEGLREEEVMKKLTEAFGPMESCAGPKGSGPAIYRRPKGFCGSIGWISALSHKFCDRCSRIRLTADGWLKTCLQYEAGLNLAERIRRGDSDDQLKSAIAEAIRKKPACHAFESGQENNGWETRPMSGIGG
ncbi:MAG TPA: GTP 3',8-cyclase MoaA [Candidatus Pullilachnospira intestinigallinarum]|nr:GTP 3',8-cyclase MoaA [Candidatus Pullilachnospira intestinigallinarum]